MSAEKAGNARGNLTPTIPDGRFPPVPATAPEIPGVPVASQAVPDDGSLIPHPRVGNREPRSTAHVRAARRERQAAELLGTRRVLRRRYEAAPDVEPITLPCGVVLQAEVKTRSKAPALVTKALAQARRYAPDAVPALVLSETGGEPLMVLPLRAFRRIAGLEAPGRAEPQCAVLFPDLGTDERRVLEAIAARLQMGAGTYGALAIAGDPRDWRKEAREEALDAAVYLAIDLLGGKS